MRYIKGGGRGGSGNSGIGAFSQKNFPGFREESPFPKGTGIRDEYFQTGSQECVGNWNHFPNFFPGIQNWITALSLPQIPRRTIVLVITCIPSLIKINSIPRLITLDKNVIKMSSPQQTVNSLNVLLVFCRCYGLRKYEYDAGRG